MNGQDEIDRALVRKLFRSTKIWETLRQVHQEQYESLKCLEKHVEGGIWFRGLEKMSDVESSLAGKSLRRLKNIGEKISKDLIKESRDLIDRVWSLTF